MRRRAKHGAHHGRVNHAAPEIEYNPDYHPARVFELWQEGLCNIPSICVELGIMESTLPKWIKQYPKFEEQYYLGRVHGKAAWLKYGTEHLNVKYFQYKTYEQLLGHSFPELKERRPVGIKNLRRAKTLEQKIQVMAELIEEGQHSPEEITFLCNTVSKLAEMGTYQQIYDQVAAVEEKNKILIANKGAVIEGDVYQEKILTIKTEKDK